MKTTKIFSVRSSLVPPILKKIAVRSSPDTAKIGFSPDPIRSSPDPCSSVVYRTGVLSSRCILNMKRLLFQKNNPFKISSKFRKQLGSSVIVSLNIKVKEEALEHQKSHHRMD